MTYRCPGCQRERVRPLMYATCCYCRAKERVHQCRSTDTSYAGGKHAIPPAYEAEHERKIVAHEARVQAEMERRSETLAREAL